MSDSLQVIAAVSIGAGVLSALLIATDLARHPQHMRIMNVVWIVTGLWSGPLGLWAYTRVGRSGSREAIAAAKHAGRMPPAKRQPRSVLAAKGTLHCGSGCTLGDVVAESLFLVAPFALFGHHLFGAWVYDYVAAFAIGIAFQYYTIKPMRDSSARAALIDALKADSLSLTAWQIGMYSWMAVAVFTIFHRELRPTEVVFWFMMQVAMLFGFVTSYPINWWLLRSGIKEPM